MPVQHSVEREIREAPLSNPKLAGPEYAVGFCVEWMLELGAKAYSRRFVFGAFSAEDEAKKWAENVMGLVYFLKEEILVLDVAARIVRVDDVGKKADCRDKDVPPVTAAEIIAEIAWR